MIVSRPTGSQPDAITAPLSGKTLSWSVSLIVHYFLAVAGGMITGFLPEVVLSRAYYNTGLDPYPPAIALTAFLWATLRVLTFAMAVRRASFGLSVFFGWSSESPPQ